MLKHSGSSLPHAHVAYGSLTVWAKSLLTNWPKKVNQTLRPDTNGCSFEVSPFATVRGSGKAPFDLVMTRGTNSVPLRV